jgi:hypothetical protein
MGMAITRRQVSTEQIINRMRRVNRAAFFLEADDKEPTPTTIAILIRRSGNNLGSQWFNVATGFQHSRAPAETERGCVEDQPQQYQHDRTLVSFLRFSSRNSIRK